MFLTRMTGGIAAALALGALAACSSGSSATSTPQQGTLKMQLTDAPFATDSVQSVNVFVVRVDGRMAAADSAAADSATAGDSASANGWVTLAAPNDSVDLLAYQNGNTMPLGTAKLTAGNFNGFRMVIDPTRSDVVLKNGTVLTGTSTPGIMFPSGSRSGIKINLTSPITVAASDTTTMLIDFNVGNSFVLRGNTIMQNGLLFKPVIQASVH
ncbi:MAG: DUF4382 domain-containing protein [Gemmatimonadota bacterium]|nr:DUF4382 domain-containing protein [Gemmatimonadota bacterium]